MSIRVLAILFIVTAVSRFAMASAQPEDGAFKTFFYDMASPITTSAAFVFWPGAIATGTLAALEDQVSDPAAQEANEDKPLGVSSKYGDLMGQAIPNALFALGAISYGYFNDDKVAYRRARHMFRSTIHAGLMTQILKNIVREPRPGDKESKVSFPSGHTATAFAFASVIGADYGWGWGVPAYALAAFVGFSRMNDNQHYFHDVVGGATLGISYGLGVYYNMIGQLETPSSIGGVRLRHVFVAENEEHGQSLWMQFTY